MAIQGFGSAAFTLIEKKKKPGGIACACRCNMQGGRTIGRLVSVGNDSKVLFKLVSGVLSRQTALEICAGRACLSPEA